MLAARRVLDRFKYPKSWRLTATVASPVVTYAATGDVPFVPDAQIVLGTDSMVDLFATDLLKLEAACAGWLAANDGEERRLLQAEMAMYLQKISVHFWYIANASSRASAAARRRRPGRRGDPLTRELEALFSEGVLPSAKVAARHLEERAKLPGNEWIAAALPAADLDSRLSRLKKKFRA